MTPRWRRPRRRGERSEASNRGATGLVFDRVPGEVVVVCGLTGGAGTTTVAFEIAAQAARESPGAVVLAESEAAQTGLATLAGRASRHGLAGVADERVGADTLDTLPLVPVAPNLSLLATMPRPAPPVRDSELAGVVDEARQRNALIVIDARTPDHMHAHALLALATRMVWVLPMTDAAARTAGTLEACGLLPPPSDVPEVLVAICVKPGRPAPVRAFAELAERRHDRLVIIPWIDSGRKAVASGTEEMRGALTQMAGVLRRSSP